MVSALDDHMDFNRSYFEMKLRLKYTDGSNVITEGNHIVNKAFFDTLLNYNRDEGETLSEPQGWFNVFGLPAKLESTTGA